MGGTIFPIIPSREHILSQEKSAINRNWVLIDNQSTVHMIHNPELLNNIWSTDQMMHILFNAGVKTTEMVVDISGVGEGWYHS